MLLRCAYHKRHTIPTRHHSYDDVEGLDVEAIGIVEDLEGLDRDLRDLLHNPPLFVHDRAVD